MMHDFDIVIVGGGIVGLGLANLLACQSQLSIAVIERSEKIEAWNDNIFYPRVSAITLDSARLFESLSVWKKIVAKRVSPFEEILVWDGKTKGEIQFKASEVQQKYLGFIIENQLIQSVLRESFKEKTNGIFFDGIELSALTEEKEKIILIDKAGKKFRSRLAIAADGSNSWLRKQIGIQVDYFGYQEKAIVTRVETEQLHQQVARQVFRQEGPLAFLPLANKHHSSIVWSLPEDKADELLKLDKTMFSRRLNTYFDHRLGEMSVLDQCLAFPLIRQQAKAYFSNKVVLVGDAAHCVHPLAGQGINLGLKDVLCLAAEIKSAMQENQPLSRCLRRYQRIRQVENQQWIHCIDLIKKIFAQDHPLLKNLRYWGLKGTNQLTFLKNLIMTYAMGQ